MTIYLTGDIHGMAQDPERFEVWNFPEGAELSRDDYLIILGDFGMPYDLLESNRDLRNLAAKPWTTLFVDGNHERFDYLNRLDISEWHGGRVQRFPRWKNIIHLMRGEVYEIDGHTFFCMGGAQSIDKDFQQANGTWFPEELPDNHEYANALNSLEKHSWHVDFVFSHTCANRMTIDALGQSNLLAVNVMSDRLTSFLDDLEDKLRYTHWFFGHFHRDARLDDYHTLLYQSIVNLDDYFPASTATKGHSAK